MNFLKKAFLALLIVNLFANSIAFSAVEASEEETTWTQTIEENKGTIAVAAVTAAIVAYVGYKYNAQIADFVSRIFSKNAAIDLKNALNEQNPEAISTMGNPYGRGY